SRDGVCQSCELLGAAQQCAARARIAGTFGRARAGLAADEGETRPRLVRNLRQRCERRIDARRTLEEALDDPILDRVKADCREPSPGREHVQRGGEALLELAEL